MPRPQLHRPTPPTRRARPHPVAFDRARVPRPHRGAVFTSVHAPRPGRVRPRPRAAPTSVVFPNVHAPCPGRVRPRRELRELGSCLRTRDKCVRVGAAFARPGVLARAGALRRGRIRPRPGRFRLRWELHADRAASSSSSTPSSHQAVLDAEEDDFFITAISDRRYTTNCTHAYQIEIFHVWALRCMRARVINT